MTYIPEISVIMSVYNSDQYLKQAVESILNQSFTDFEFIITDDCSTDGSAEILENYKLKDKRIILLRNSENIGLTKSLNSMLEMAKGKYIARMDADDISLPERFNKQHDFMERNPEIGVLGANIRYFGIVNKITDHPIEHDEIKIELLFECIMNHPSIFMRKKVIDEHKIRYNENFRISQDYELWSRMINNTKFANLKDVLIDYRFEKTNITNTHNEEYKNKLLNKIFSFQFEKLEIDLNKTELDPFSFLVKNDKISDLKLLLRIEELLIKMLEQNNDRKIYDQESFCKRLSEKWFELCTRSSVFGMKVFFTYSRSVLSKDFDPGLVYKFKFFIKCLIKYEKNSG
jgi:glycosyltransferase involved in cell wall biosynthesis